MCVRRNVRRMVPGGTNLIWLSLYVLSFGFLIPARAQSTEAQSVQSGVTGILDFREADDSIGERQSDHQLSGYVSGTVIDQAGAVAVGAQVRLTREGQLSKREILSGDNGEFSFASLPPGPFQLTITAEGFETQKFSGTVHLGEAYLVPAITLVLATVVTEVRVGGTQIEVAQEQIKEQEKQRVLGFIPNFYVSYVPDAVPLVSRQKFELAWKSTIDPFTFVGVAALAGVQQGTDDFAGYGQGLQGYAKRFGAAYADVVFGTFIGSAILPSLLKQDPRYFYKGTGSSRSRLFYALASTAICRGDNQRWQPNYSVILGSFATGGTSYLYYPAKDRDAKEIILQNSLIRIGESAFENILQEFIIRKLTPRLQSHPPIQP
jgi:hypothetical protein